MNAETEIRAEVEEAKRVCQVEDLALRVELHVYEGLYHQGRGFVPFRSFILVSNLPPPEGWMCKDIVRPGEEFKDVRGLMPGGESIGVQAVTMEERVLERCYFHIYNGGLTLEIIERSPERPEYFLGISLSNFILWNRYEIPLYNHEVVGWVHAVTGRLLPKMRSIEFARLDSGKVSHEEGQPVEYQIKWVWKGYVLKHGEATIQDFGFGSLIKGLIPPNEMSGQSAP